MATHPVTVVRIYTREAEHQMEALLHFLREEARVAGATVLRGVQGFGADGVMRSSGLLALTLDLPLILEFYDHPERIDDVLSALEKRMSLRHMISWQAQLHLSGD
jgi:PII-like signaling protein